MPPGVRGRERGGGEKEKRGGKKDGKGGEQGKGGRGRRGERGQRLRIRSLTHHEQLQNRGANANCATTGQRTAAKTDPQGFSHFVPAPHTPQSPGRSSLAQPGKSTQSSCTYRHRRGPAWDLNQREDNRPFVQYLLCPGALSGTMIMKAILQMRKLRLGSGQTLTVAPTAGQ